MKWIVSPILVSVLALPVSAGEIDAKAALGGALGGATGAAVGSAPWVDMKAQSSAGQSAAPRAQP